LALDGGEWSASQLGHCMKVNGQLCAMNAFLNTLILKYHFQWKIELW